MAHGLQQGSWLTPKSGAQDFAARLQQETRRFDIFCYTYTNMLGILFAIGALVFWTVGDFTIQKTTKVIGDWKALFFIGVVGGIGLLPFVIKDLPTIFHNSANLWLLLIVSLVTLVGALFLFEGLKRGKISIIEPVFGLELPLTIFVVILFGGEHLDLLTYCLIALVFIGLLLAVTKSAEHLHFHKTIFEKGVLFAAIGSVGMGFMNYLTGIGSQTISPLATIWFIHTFLAIACFIYFLIKGNAHTILSDIKKYPGTIFIESVFDNLAWICYAVSMALIPISIATTISESYIALVVLLGVLVNKEKIQKHQIFGIILALGTVILLTVLVE